MEPKDRGVEELSSLIERMACDAKLLATSEDILASVAGKRITAILVNLVMEISPMTLDGPWEELCAND